MRTVSTCLVLRTKARMAVNVIFFIIIIITRDERHTCAFQGWENSFVMTISPHSSVRFLVQGHVFPPPDPSTRITMQFMLPAQSLVGKSQSDLQTTPLSLHQMHFYYPQQRVLDMNPH